MNIKQLREYYGVSKRTFRKRIELLPNDLKALIPRTNGIMFPGVVKKLISHWDTP